MKSMREKPQLFFRTPFTLITGKFTVTQMKSALLFLPGIFKGLFQNFFDVQPESPVITDIDSSVKLAFKELLSCTDFTEQVAWTMLIFSKLIKKLNLTHKQSIPVAGLTKKITTYISLNFKENITLDLLAKEFCVSKFYISHTFSEKLKVSLSEYVSSIRAKYAAEQLLSTDDSITNIALNSGFSSQSTFNRTFLKIYGMSPREYRNNF